MNKSRNIINRFFCLSVSTTCLSASLLIADENSHRINVYATLRPTLAYIDEQTSLDDDDNIIDVRDFNSFIGIKSHISVSDHITAILQGEWAIETQDNAELGRGRRAYAGLELSHHRVAIGKQRPPQYLLIASQIDISNNENSPFSYIQSGYFFVDNLLTYRYKHNNVQLLSAAQFNGYSGKNKADFFNTGISYKINNMYIAGSFLQNTNPDSANSIHEGNKNTTYASAISTKIGNMYFALAYQDTKIEIAPTSNTDTLIENKNMFSGNTVDFVTTYGFDNGNKIRLGLFSYDDGGSTNRTQEYKGFGVTLERQLHQSVRVHIDYLHRNYTTRANYNAIAVGIRYDINFNFLTKN